MKKIILFILVVFVYVAFAKDVSNGYVDLGLPSGTLWKATDEVGYYTYPSARYFFGDSLPNSEQVNELFYNCTWRWTGKGYRATGPNQNTIYFASNGYRDCDEDMHDYGSSAVLWTLDNAGSNFAYFYIIWEGGRAIVEDSNCRGCTVRLVKNE